MRCPAFLIGTGDLLGADGSKIGTSSFQGISTDAKPRTAEMLTFVYELADGKITTSGTALTGVPYSLWTCHSATAEARRAARRWLVAIESGANRWERRMVEQN